MGKTARLLAGLLLGLLVCAQLVAAPVAPNEALISYVGQADPATHWEKGNTWQMGSVQVTDILLTSQSWHGITWRHVVRLFEPAKVAYPGWLHLLVAGGSGDPTPGKELGYDREYALPYTRLMQAPVAVLYNVPNQPILGGLREDDAISYTFAQYMQDGDRTWPLLFPMVKSAVRAMDALQAVAKERGRPISSFTVQGSSKRGWTTWLTGAYDGGRRVKAIMPCVIDILNMPQQLPHQVEMLGGYSEEISEYTSKGFQALLTTERGQELVTMVDPYSYRARHTMPKLVVLGTNDPYWSPDALNLYWDGLPAPKYVLYTPNSRHGLDDRVRVINTVSAFFRMVAGHRPLPEMSWQREAKDGQVTITVTAPTALGGRLWTASAATTDFRLARRQADPLQYRDGTWVGTAKSPAGQQMVVFAELDFEDDGKPYTLSTQNIIARQ